MIYHTADGLVLQTVRRLALSSLNSSARTKPHLLREHLKTLQPILYKETVINPDLIRTVQMGPWTHKVDDGLETRKTAYETMYTLVCLPVEPSSASLTNFTHSSILASPNSISTLSSVESFLGLRMTPMKSRSFRT